MLNVSILTIHEKYIKKNRRYQIISPVPSLHDEKMINLNRHTQTN
jgi:hypothetical protein